MESVTTCTLSQTCGMQMLTSEHVTDKFHAKGRYRGQLEHRGSPAPARGSTCGLGDDSSRGGAALEDTRGSPRRQADCGLPCGRAVADGASRWGKMCWTASVCFSTAENCWAQLSTVSPNSPARETRASKPVRVETEGAPPIPVKRERCNRSATMAICSERMHEPSTNAASARWMPRH